MLGLGSGSARTEVKNSVRQGLSCTTFRVGSRASEDRKERHCQHLCHNPTALRLGMIVPHSPLTGAGLYLEPGTGLRHQQRFWRPAAPLGEASRPSAEPRPLAGGGGKSPAGPHRAPPGPAASRAASPGRCRRSRAAAGQPGRRRRGAEAGSTRGSWRTCGGRGRRTRPARPTWRRGPGGQAPSPRETVTTATVTMETRVASAGRKASVAMAVQGRPAALRAAGGRWRPAARPGPAGLLPGPGGGSDEAAARARNPLGTRWHPA